MPVDIDGLEQSFFLVASVNEGDVTCSSSSFLLFCELGLAVELLTYQASLKPGSIQIIERFAQRSVISGHLRVHFQRPLFSFPLPTTSSPNCRPSSEPLSQKASPPSHFTLVSPLPLLDELSRPSTLRPRPPLHLPLLAPPKLNPSLSTTPP
jgi:hypothetical protein